MRTESGGESLLSGLACASMAVRSSSGLVCYTDIFGDLSRQEDVKPHLQELVDWIRGQRVKYDVTDDSGSINFLFYTNTAEEEKLLSRVLGSMGFHTKDIYIKKIHYFWQDFESLKSS